MTPGVPAYAAAAALVGRELTVPLVAQSVVLTRAQARSTAMPAGEALANFAATGATLVVHLAITRTRELMDELAGHYGADCPVVVVHRASQPGQLVLRGTVADIAEQVELAGLRQAAVILVGRALEPDDPAQSFLYDPSRDRSTKRRPSSAERLLLVGRTSLTGHFWLAIRQRRQPELPSRRTPAHQNCPLGGASADVARGPHLAGGRTTGRGRADDQQALHVDRLGVELGRAW